MKATLQKETRPAQARPVEYVVPEVNITETKDGYVLEAEMPGVTKEGLEITLEGCEMTIVGHREVAACPGEELLRESRDASFRRLFQLDPAIDTARIGARVDQGLLTLTLPKSEKLKPRKISVE